MKLVDIDKNYDFKQRNEASKITPIFSVAYSEEEKREFKRHEIRDGEQISASIAVSNRWILDKVKIVDISFKGLGILIDENDISRLNIEEDMDLLVRVKIGISDCFILKTKVVTISSVKYSHLIKIGLECSIIKDKSYLTSVFSLPESCPLSGYVVRNHVFAEKSNISVRELSAKEITITLFDNNPVIFPSMDIQLFLLLPNGEKELNCKVLKIVDYEQGWVTIKLQILDMDSLLGKKLTQYLIENMELSPSRIRFMGFASDSFKSSLRATYVKTTRDYDEVLSLRKLAYSSSGKVSKDAKLEEMKTNVDHISRIICIYHFDELVGSATVAFPSNDNILDTEAPLENGYPKDFPGKGEMIEVSRVCIHPNYRGEDVLLKMFEKIVWIAATKKINYLISSTDDRMWKIYKKMGFIKTSVSYDHPHLKDIKHDIILCHWTTPIYGKKVGPFAYGFFYKQIGDYMKSMGVIKRKVTMRLMIYGFLNKILMLFKS